MVPNHCMAVRRCRNPATARTTRRPALTDAAGGAPVICARKATPSAVRRLPPAGSRWHAPHGLPVCSANSSVADAGATQAKRHSSRIMRRRRPIPLLSPRRRRGLGRHARFCGICGPFGFAWDGAPCPGRIYVDDAVAAPGGLLHPLVHVVGDTIRLLDREAARHLSASFSAPSSPPPRASLTPPASSTSFIGMPGFIACMAAFRAASNTRKSLSCAAAGGPTATEDSPKHSCRSPVSGNHSRTRPPATLSQSDATSPIDNRSGPLPRRQEPLPAR